MADISLCSKTDCPKRDGCRRGTEKASAFSQSYFAPRFNHSPLTGLFSCEFFMPCKQSIFESFSCYLRSIYEILPDYSFTGEDIDKHEAYFKKCMYDNVSPYIALEQFWSVVNNG